MLYFKRRCAVARAPAGPGHLLPDWLCRQAPAGPATGTPATPLPFPGGRSPGSRQIAGGKLLVADSWWQAAGGRQLVASWWWQEDHKHNFHIGNLQLAV